MSAEPRNLLKDESGAAFLEFTAVVFTFLSLLFGVVEFSYAYFQWNAATKAMQHGARVAAVSDPVMTELPNISGLNDETLPGEAYAGTFDVECSIVEGTGTCACTGAECPDAASFNSTAMTNIVYGRGKTACAAATSAQDLGMCNFLPRIAAENVVVRYQYTGLGYAGRPGGPVPTITVSLKDLKFDFILMSAFLGVNEIDMPSFATTVTGEDLYVSGSAG